ncbi:MAG: PAS domain S-box protein [Pseudomonadota bacterium]
MKPIPSDQLLNELHLYQVEVTSQIELQQEHAAIFKIIFDGALDGISLIDATSKQLIAFNPAFCNMLGYSSDELSSLSTQDLHRQQDWHHIVELMDGHLRGDMDVCRDVPFLRKDGSLAYADVKASCVNNGGKENLIGIFRDITKIKVTDIELAEKNERLTLMLNKLEDVFWMADLQISKMLYISPGYERIWGRTTQSLYENPQSYIEAIHPEDRERALYHIDSHETGQPFEHEYRIIRPDGTVKWVWDRGFPIHNQSGEVTSYTGIAKDITQRKLAEITLKNKLSEQEMLFNNSPQSMMTLAPPSWKFTGANRAALQFFGASSVKEFISLGPWDVSPDLQPDGQLSSVKASEMISLAMNEGSIYFEWVHKRLNGTLFQADVLLTRHEIDGEVFIQATTRDITKRKQTEADLRIAAVAFESQEAMMVTDATNVILRVNNAFTMTTGYTAADAIGQSPRILKSDRHNVAFYAAMWKTLLRDGSWQGEIWNRRKNGEVYPERLSITAVKSDAEKVTHYVATFHDISDRKLIEKQIVSMAYYDALTQLPNRRLLDNRLRRGLDINKRSGRYGALMFLDMDKFKSLNDTHGHGAGDLLLIEVARRISSCVRKTDTVSRFGGDEFVVLLSELYEDKAESTLQARLVAEKICIILAEPYLLNIQQDGKADNPVAHHCTSSIGVTLFTGHQTSVEELFKRADVAMYQAKTGGGNLICFNEAGTLDSRSGREEIWRARQLFN